MHCFKKLNVKYIKGQTRPAWAGFRTGEEEGSKILFA